MGWLDFFASLAGSLAWPAAFAYAIYLFRQDISRMMPGLRIKHGESELSFAFLEGQKSAASQLPPPEDIGDAPEAGEHLPPEVAGLTELSDENLRRRVSQLASEMRALQAEFDGDRDALTLNSGYTWNERIREMSRQSTLQRTRWLSGLHPLAVAVLAELTRRVGQQPDEGGSATAIEYGMLAGPAPLNDAALYLEKLARRLGTEGPASAAPIS